MQGRQNIIAIEEFHVGPDAGYWKIIPSVFEMIQTI
jgi:hypothetical protein